MGQFLLLKPESVDAGQGQVLRRDDYALLLESEGILTAARDEADRIVREAKEAFEAEKERGFHEGIEAGKMEMTMRMLDNAVESVNMISSMEDSMIDVVMRSLRTIIGDMARKDVVASLVKKALQYVRDQKKIVVRLNPDEAEEAQFKIEEVCRETASMARVDVVPDARLDPGMCIIETELGSVDASLDKQLAFIEQALRREVGSHG